MLTNRLDRGGISGLCLRNEKNHKHTNRYYHFSYLDLMSLKHGINEDVDWWSLPEDEVEEVNKGNVLFLNLGDDGANKVNIKKNHLKTCLE